MTRPTSTPLLLCCLLAASFLIAGATLTPVSNCAKSGRQVCILRSAKEGSKLTCCVQKNAASSYPQSGCVDLLTDPGYCGSCTKSCAKDQKCVAGKCVSVPPPPPEDFSCALILCLAPSTCCSGTCCTGNAACCSGSCTDLQNDSANCGQCGRTCGYPPGVLGIPRFCSEGNCVNG